MYIHNKHIHISSEKHTSDKPVLSSSIHGSKAAAILLLPTTAPKETASARRRLKAWSMARSGLKWGIDPLVV